MTVHFRSRSPRRTTRILSCAVLLLSLLGGCQSPHEREIALKKADLQRQIDEANAKKPVDANAPDPNSAAHASEEALGMPLYPGAKMDGPPALPNTSDGIAMTLIETSDSIDKVTAFYTDALKASAGKLPPTRVEENRSGKRVVRLSLPRDDGGLQTVEATGENGTTMIQLMNVQPGKSRPGVPIPGVNAGADSGATSAFPVPTLPDNAAPSHRP